MTETQMAQPASYAGGSDMSTDPAAGWSQAARPPAPDYRPKLGKTWILLMVVMIAAATSAGALAARSHYYADALDQAHREVMVKVRELEKNMQSIELPRVVTTLGLFNRRLRMTAKGELAPDAPDLVADLVRLRNRLQADIVYVMNPQGVVVASSPMANGTIITGKNYSFRRYFRRAIRGLPATDSGLGATTGQRGVFYSAPLYDEVLPPTNGVAAPDRVIGVVVVKQGLAKVDEFLGKERDPALLINPDGIVFSTNRPELMYRVRRPDAIPDLRILGTAQQMPLEPLPFNLLADHVTYAGRRYTLLHQTAHVGNTEDRWDLVFLRNISVWHQTLMATLVVFSFAVVMGLAATGERHRRLVRRETARKERQAAEALAESHQRLNEIIEFLPDAILVIDRQGRVVAWNRAMEELSGIPKSQMIGKGNREYSLPFFGERREILADQVLRDAIDRPLEERGGPREDNTRVNNVFVPGAYRGKGAYLWGRAAPLYDNQGRVAGAIETIRDISETKHAEEEARALQEKLVQAQKLESVGRLAGGVAHEYNNILTGIQGYTELLQAACPPGDPHSFELNEIRKATKRAADITTQLLAFSRRQVTTPRVVDLNSLVGNFNQTMGRLIGESVLVVFRPGSELGAVFADPTQLEQALMDLVMNAREATPVGGRVIIETGNAVLDEDYCRHHPDATPGDYVRLSVCDQGPGLPPDALEHLFEPFYTTKAFGQGIGLGLSTVYGVVKQNHGHIAVRCEGGVGTCFDIYLPRVERATTPVETRAAEPDSPRQRTVLLVDDEEIIREVARRMLGAMGYHVLVANTAAEAQRFATEQGDNIDVLLTDVVMPDMNGVDLYEQLHHQQPGLRVLFMTGYAENIIADREAAASREVITKPFLMDELGLKMREVLAAPPG